MPLPACGGLSSSGRSASTTVQPLLLADRMQLLEERRGDPVGVVLGVDDQEVDRADVAAGSDGRPKGQDRATDDHPLRSPRRRCLPAAGRRAGASDQPPRAGSSARSIAPSASLSATIRSMSVTRAARTRYSTPTGPYLAGFGDHRPSIGFDRGDTGARDPLVGDERRLARDALREGAADRYCIQVADALIYGIASAATCAPPGSDLRHRRHASPLALADRPGESRRRGRVRAHDRRSASGPGRRQGLRPGSRQVVTTGDLEEILHETAKIGALAAVSVLAFAACSSQRRHRRSAAPSGSAAAAGGPAGSSARTRRARARPRSTSTRACRARARTRSRRTRSSSRSSSTLDGQKIGDFTIKYFDLDDSSAANNGDWDGAVEQQNANKAAADPDAMVYIGTYNSGAAKLSIPILNAACLVMISPANTYPGLTKAVEGVTQPGEPDSYYPGGYRNYARVDRDRRRPGRALAPNGPSPSAQRRPTSSTTPRSTARAWPRRGPSMPTRSASRSSAPTRRPKASTRRRPTTARSPRRSRPPVRTSSTSAPSPARTPASSGRTSGRHCPTSR